MVKFQCPSYRRVPFHSHLTFNCSKESSRNRRVQVLRERERERPTHQFVRVSSSQICHFPPSDQEEPVSPSSLDSHYACSWEPCPPAAMANLGLSCASNSKRTRRWWTDKAPTLSSPHNTITQSPTSMQPTMNATHSTWPGRHQPSPPMIRPPQYPSGRCLSSVSLLSASQELATFSQWQRQAPPLCTH